jgi:hypothetical protein
MEAVRLDNGRGRSGTGGVDFFALDQDSKAKSDLVKFGPTAKIRFSNTVLSYGTQRPALPIYLITDDSRLLTAIYTGFVQDSQEIDGFNLGAGYFAAER